MKEKRTDHCPYLVCVAPAAELVEVVVFFDVVDVVLAVEVVVFPVLVVFALVVELELVTDPEAKVDPIGPNLMLLCGDESGQRSTKTVNVSDLNVT